MKDKNYFVPKSAVVEVILKQARLMNSAEGTLGEGSDRTGDDSSKNRRNFQVYGKCSDTLKNIRIEVDTFC